MTGGYICMWSFFGFGHGKGLHDGVGVILKRFIRKCQLDAIGPKLQNAEQVTKLLCELSRNILWRAIKANQLNLLAYKNN
jgi:hypothetical protein